MNHSRVEDAEPVRPAASRRGSRENADVHRKVLRPDPQDIAAFNKFVRTFATQLEALKRYRTGGEQKVTVQHVSVSEGGQAIVGNVTHAVAATAPEKVVNSSPGLTEAREAPTTVVGGSGPKSARDQRF